MDLHGANFFTAEERQQVLLVLIFPSKSKQSSALEEKNREEKAMGEAKLHHWTKG